MNGESAWRPRLTYDRGMLVLVNVQTVQPRKLAAVGLWTDGHNSSSTVAQTSRARRCYASLASRSRAHLKPRARYTRPKTPAGEAAIAVHRGPYNRMNEAYSAIDQWIAANRRESAWRSWGIYGDPTPEPDDTETTIVTLLKGP